MTGITENAQGYLRYTTSKTLKVGKTELALASPHFSSFAPHISASPLINWELYNALSPEKTLGFLNLFTAMSGTP